MTLLQILVFSGLALAIGLWPRVRKGALLVVSVLAIYWMQPPAPIRNLDFWLPTITLGITAWVWAATRQEKGDKGKGAGESAPIPYPLSPILKDALFILVPVFSLALTRYIEPICCITPTRPPEIGFVLIGVGALALVGWGISRWLAEKNWVINALVWGLLALFVVLKTDWLAQMAATGLRSLTGQTPNLASGLDIRWLGFSYVAFRLIHTLRDRLAGRLPTLGLAEFVSYVIFFPAFTAGPIDRVQRFNKDLAGGVIQSSTPNEGSYNPKLVFERSFAALKHQFWALLSSRGMGEQLLPGLYRITWGIFKKFAIADTLALIALNAANAPQVRSAGWMWVLLYAYALRIYFDFSGYTDIAIGLGKLMGFNLPENFERPYFKSNLTTFWNSWHITLAQWFRAYWFNPITRTLRSGKWQPPMWIVILIGQITTMLLIGLWHGVTWNFALWGLWHGVGLFIHNRWGEATKTRLAAVSERPWLQKTFTALGVLATFHYVALGWVWFALPSVPLSWQVLGRLFGL